MTIQSLRQVLSLLPTRATTGIGSLPHTQQELALQMALQADIPYLPQLPVGHPSEFMIASALEGVPGLSYDAEGMCSVDLTAWRAGFPEFTARLERALTRADSARDFEPSPEACRSWKPFLWEVENRKLAFAKVQIAGPFTVRWVARTEDGQALAQTPEMDQAIFRLLLAKSLAMVKALRQVNVTPLFFLDEPGLYALDTRDARHVLAMQELKLLATALQREGALVGLHCCSNTDWGNVLSLGFNLLSLDVRLSLDAVLDDARALKSFLDGGGAFSFGIVPTNLDATFRIEELVDAVETALQSTLPKKRAEEVLSRSLLTPACGLAMRSVVDAEQIVVQLKEAQRLLKKGDRLLFPE